MLSKHECGQNPLEGLFKHNLLDPTPRIPGSVCLGGAGGFAFLTYVLVIMMVLAWGAHFENGNQIRGL